MRRNETEPQNGPPVDLFEYQSIPQGGWVVLDVSGCVV